MSGNIWEWNQDWYDSSYYISSGRTNPTGPSTGFNRTSGGGYWDFSATLLRVAYRGNNSPARQAPVLGIRLARTVFTDETGSGGGGGGPDDETSGSFEEL
jgi:formylglycine-generating enzyme required for sulfatase activity